MSLLIRALELLAHHTLGAAVALRGFRGDPDDAHALAHAAVAQAALDSENCSGGHHCRADIVLNALERRKEMN